MHDFQRQAIENREARRLRKLARGERTPFPTENWAFQKYWAIKKRAAEKGWDFDLTLEWMQERLQQTHCAATGIEFEDLPGGAFRRSIDRRDSAGGYTMANCWAVCWIYNRAKLDGSHEDVMRMAHGLIKTKN
jgi:hypothetical protein